MDEKQAAQTVGEMREQRARDMSVPVMTIREAVELAQWLRRTPDGIIPQHKVEQAMAALLAALEASQCYLKATLAGEQTFVLRQRDRAAPAAISVWAMEAQKHGCSDDKTAEAHRMAASWAMQPDSATKWPD